MDANARECDLHDPPDDVITESLGHEEARGESSPVEPMIPSCTCRIMSGIRPDLGRGRPRAGHSGHEAP